MKNKLLLGIFSIGIIMPCLVGASGSDGWVVWHQVSSSQYLEKTCVGESIKNFSCDYTWDPVVLRMWYDVEFNDTFYAWSQNRRLWDFCAGIIEPENNGDYNNWSNPWFDRTNQINDAGWLVQKNSNMMIIQTKRDYQIRRHPVQRSSNNLMVKYVVEYANDGSDNPTRYQHTECYPYIISRCGDGVIDKDWDGKTADKPGEECDPEHPDWKNRTDGKVCSASCTIQQAPICNSQYNGKRVYTSTSSAYLNGSEWLCISWTVMWFNPTWTVQNPRNFTWWCTSNVGSTANNACSLKQYRCGDGIVSAEWTNWNYSNGAHYEQCDPEASEWKNRTDGKKCSSSCNIEYVPSSCGRLNGNKAYNTGYSSPRITENSAWLCGTWKLVAWSLSYNKNTWKYTWSCQNWTSPAVACNAEDLWCGDGQVTNGEQCDPNDPDRTWWKDWSWKSCNSSCKLEDIPRVGPVCSSVYNGTTQYTSTSNPWISTSDTLCSKWNLVQWSFNYSGSPRTFTWSCTNDGITTGCIAYQQWCGDGKKNGTEVCDPKDSSHLWWGDGCSETCQPTYDAKCGSKYNGKTTYLDISKDWITKNTQWLCDKWNVINFAKHPSSKVYTWQCENHWKVSEECRADQQWCGDKMKNGDEDCDGTDACDSECKKIIPNTGCDQIFTWALRLGDNDPFYDVFNAGWRDRYLFYYDVNFKENHGNYDNKAQDPTYNWTSQLVNNWMKVSANTSMKVIESNPYHIVTPPTARAWNNLYIEYTIWYDNVNHSTSPSTGNLYSHKECAYYEISRCGDGILDTEEGEKCDPGSPEWKNRPDGKECNSSCEIVYNPKWEPKIEKTLVWKKTVEKTGEILTWEVRVVASWGSVSWFTVEDIVPAALKYKSSKVTSNRDNLKVSEATKTKTTTTWEVYTWEVTWELKEGHELIIEVTTEVVKMPKSEDDYRNVACVIKDNKKDCDDDKPNPVVWEPKIEKTLVWKKTVEKTGEILTWEVRVVASWGSVSWFTVEDIVPAALKYKSSKVTSNRDNLKVSEATKTKTTTTWEVYTWEVTWELKEGHELIIEVTTEVVKMPKSEDDYRNVACVIKDNKKDCDDDKPSPTAWELDVEKTLISEDKYVSHVWQGLEWKVTVKAKYWDVKLERIRDIFPAKYLSFTGYETLWDWKAEWINITHFEADNNKGVAVWDVTWTLQSWHKIELKVYTIVHTMPEWTVKNVACVKPVDPWKEDCGTGYTSDLRIKKFVWDKNKWAKSTTGNSWDTITYKIEFGNYGDTGVYVTLKDFLPKDIQVTASSLSLNYENHDTEFWSDNENPYRWKWEKVDNVYINIYSWVYLRPNSEWVMMITWTALHSDSSNHNRTNFACIYENGKKIACDDAIYNVEEEKNVKCISLKNGSNVTLGCDEEPEDRPTEVTCRSSKPAKIEIVCKDFNGNEEIVEEADGVTELTWSCSFSTIKHNSVQCKIDGKVDEKCVAEYNMSTKDCPTPTQPICTDIKVKWKTVTCYADEDAYFRIQWCYGLEPGENNTKKMGEDREPDHTFKCPDGVSPKAYCQVSKTGKDGEWDTSDDCKNPDSDIPKEFQTCFNVNAWNFSIEEWEIFPFYWNLMNLEKVSTDKGNKEDIYVEVNDWDYDNAISTYTAWSEDSCDDGQIAIDSMVCTFEIYDGGKYNALNSNAEPLYTIKWPCLSEGEAYTNSKLIQAWYDEMVETHCGSESKSAYCYMSFNLNREGKWLLNSSVYYIQKFWDWAGVYLNGKPRDKAEWTDWKKDESKKSLGEYKIRLANVEYLQCNGGSWEQTNGWDSVVCEHDFMVTSPYTIQKTPSGNLKASTDELSRYRSIEGKYTFTWYVEKIDTTAYNANSDVKEAMDEFISKYAKLAVDVKTKGKFEIPSGTTIKKVPGKNIYFVDWKITIKWGKNIDTPFTLVQTSWSTIIEWNVGHNMMLLTRWNIKFSWDCTSDQTVKWIYYAEKKLLRNEVGKNKDLDVRVWCTNGWLHVKWVLIWGWFDDLMKDSRSNLNKWFDGTTSRKTTLMNWWSVVIEYSPSIFTKSTMPPGAEDFTTALSIYRQ